MAPSYEQRSIDPESILNKLARIAAPQPRQSEIRLLQDAQIWAARFDREEEAIYTLESGRRAWVQIARGEVTVGGAHLKSGDGAALSDIEQVRIRTPGPAEILLFDLA